VTRILTAVVLLPFFVVALWLPEPAYFNLFAVGAAILAGWEYFALARATGMPASRAVGLLWILGLLASAWWPELLRPEWVSLAAFAGLAGLVLFSGMDLRGALGLCAGTAFGALYVGGLMAYVILLKAEGPREHGRDLILLLAGTMWLGDSAAYYGGSLLGRHKLAPRISPKKTWEGAAAGLLGSIAAALLATVTWMQWMSVLHAVVLACLLSAVGQAGDLFESALKRGAAVKDSSALLPGHGGMLDRIDSLLFAAPLLFYYHRVWLA